MFHVWIRPISGNLRVTVRFDLDSAVTSRYDLRSIVAAIAAYAKG
jgi:hypothetical protein